VADSATALITELERLSDRWIAPHTARLRAGHSHARPKVINDPVWGTIRLYSWEAALLDTSLLQRLRYIRQLGVAHWVFPGAGHSRLEHSVGVLHQMQQLIDGLERNSGLAGERIVDDVTSKLLRIAALVHDCGHSAFSHVSEPLVAALPGVQDLIRQMVPEYKTRKDPSPSEAFAVVFVRSRAFRDFLSATEVGADFIRDVGDATRRIAGYVVAGAVDPGKEYLSLLLNGPFDADKLDYMPRDSAMAGIPSAVDVKRIIEKVHTVTVPSSKLPQDYARWAAPSNGYITTLALSSAGSRALHELAVTKNFLFDKVYQHHKVQALELIARRLLDEKRGRGGLDSIREWLSVTDDDLVRDRSLIHARMLRERRIPKRAFFIKGPEKELKGTKLTDWLDLRDDTKSGALQQIIQKEAVRLADCLGFSADSLRVEPLAVNFPDLTRSGLDRHAFIGDSPEDFKLAATAFVGERAEAGRRVSSAEGYVFAPEEAVLPVFLAARSVLSGQYRQAFDSSAYRRAKLHPQDIRDAEDTLAKKGLVRPRAASRVKLATVASYRAASLEYFLKTAWPRIEALHDTFGQYQVPGAGPITSTSIARFLRQFESEGLARAALRMLEHVDFKSRRYFAQSLEAIMAAALQLGQVAAVSPLGATGDSSALLTYLMNDIPQRLRRPVMQLELALESRAGGQIVLWDDFCGAAGHTKTALIQWLGLPGHALNERLTRRLTRVRGLEFRRRPILISFSLGRRSGLRRLAAFLGEHALKNVTLLSPPDIVSDKDEVFSGRKVFPDRREREGLMQFLSEQAKRLLMHKLTRRRNPWRRIQLEERLLGYGNTAKLLVFYYNVPTVTMTALWEAGDNWVPLFRRRPKPAA
jgi:HD superfamily phosphohydrolase